MEPAEPGATDTSVGTSFAPAGSLTSDLGVWPAPPEADVELIARAQANPNEFAAIYRLHYQAIGRYLYRRVGNRDAAEDLVAETFLVALREIRRFEWRGIPILHWLYRIAT